MRTDNIVLGIVANRRKRYAYKCKTLVLTDRRSGMGCPRSRFIIAITNEVVPLFEIFIIK